MPHPHHEQGSRTIRILLPYTTLTFTKRRSRIFGVAAHRIFGVAAHRIFGVAAHQIFTTLQTLTDFTDSYRLYRLLQTLQTLQTLTNFTTLTDFTTFMGSYGLLLVFELIDPDPVDLHGGGESVFRSVFLQVRGEVDAHLFLGNCGGYGLEHFVVDLPDQLSR